MVSRGFPACGRVRLPDTRVPDVVDARVPECNVSASATLASQTSIGQPFVASSDCRCRQVRYTVVRCSGATAPTDVAVLRRTRRLIENYETDTEPFVFEVYGSEDCPYSRKTVDLLSRNELPFYCFETSLRRVCIDAVREHFKGVLPRDFRTIPIVFARNASERFFVGGYTELVTFLNAYDRQMAYRAVVDTLEKRARNRPGAPDALPRPDDHPLL